MQGFACGRRVLSFPAVLAADVEGGVAIKVAEQGDRRCCALTDRRNPRLLRTEVATGWLTRKLHRLALRNQNRMKDRVALGGSTTAIGKALRRRSRHGRSTAAIQLFLHFFKGCGVEDGGGLVLQMIEPLSPISYIREHRWAKGAVLAGALLMAGTFVTAVVRVAQRYNSPTSKRRRSVNKNLVRIVLS